jgi:hypothetical protein
LGDCSILILLLDPEEYEKLFVEVEECQKELIKQTLEYLTTPKSVSYNASCFACT